MSSVIGLKLNVGLRSPCEQVEKEVKKELEADKPEGEEALNNLFKQIYGNVSSPDFEF